MSAFDIGGENLGREQPAVGEKFLDVMLDHFLVVHSFPR